MVKSVDLFKVKEVEEYLLACDIRYMTEERISILENLLTNILKNCNEHNLNFSEKVNFCELNNKIRSKIRNVRYMNNCDQCMFATKKENSIHFNNHDDISSLDSIYYNRCCIEIYYDKRKEDKQKLCEFILKNGVKKFCELLLLIREIYV